MHIYAVPARWERSRAHGRAHAQVASRVHLAIFDDAFYERFHLWLDQQHETYWFTNMDAAYLQRSAGAPPALEPLYRSQTALNHSLFADLLTHPR